MQVYIVCHGNIARSQVMSVYLRRRLAEMKAEATVSSCGIASKDAYPNEAQLLAEVRHALRRRGVHETLERTCWGKVTADAILACDLVLAADSSIKRAIIERTGICPSRVCLFYEYIGEEPKDFVDTYDHEQGKQDEERFSKLFDELERIASLAAANIVLSSAEQSRSRRFIQFLGTGAAQANLEVDEFLEHAAKCRDGHCAEVARMQGKNIRHATSVLIGGDVLVDFYSDLTLRSCGIAATDIRHLVITHAHFDHFNPQSIWDFSLALPQMLHIYGNSIIREAMEFAAKYRFDTSTGRFHLRQQNASFRTTTVLPGKTFTIGKVKATPVLANHAMDKKYLLNAYQALNYVFEYDGRTIFYGMDSSYMLPESFEMLRQFQFDVCVFDATYGNCSVDPLVSGHQNFAMLLQTKKEFAEAGLLKPDTQIIANHLAVHEVEPHDTIAEGLAKQGIILAYDGMLLQ